MTKYKKGQQIGINIRGFKKFRVNKDCETYVTTMYEVDPDEDGNSRWVPEQMLDSIIEMGASTFEVEETIDDGSVILQELEEGQAFSFGGIEWEILNKDFHDGVFVLAKDLIEKQKFDDDNSSNWKTSTARKYLNTTFKNHLEKQVGKDILMEFHRDLTSDDGSTEYGYCVDYVSIISCDEYRRYRKYISDRETSWWTLTSESTPNFGFWSYVRYIYTDGTPNNCCANGVEFSLFPVIVLPKNTKVIA